MEKETSENKEGMTRRDMVKTAAATCCLSVLALSGCAGKKDSGTGALKGKKMAMVIDLQRCTGCGGCSLACRAENNTSEGVFWSNKITETYGQYPNVNFEYIPTLCNHCEKAPCVQVCPTSAMHVEEGKIVNHKPDICIGCKACAIACPYDAIYYNKEKPHGFWLNDDATLNNVTATGQEVNKQVNGKGTPYYNPARDKDTPNTGVRGKGIVEKCNFCLHRVKRGQLPACVEACPCNARIFGDLNDPNSEVSQLLGKYKPKTLQTHLGTSPKVFYIRSYNQGAYKSTKGNL